MQELLDDTIEMEDILKQNLKKQDSCMIDSEYAELGDRVVD